MSTITVPTNFTAGVHTTASVQATNNYVQIPIKWSNLNGYPEIVVETSIDDTDYYPAKILNDYDILVPVKLRCELEDGREMILVDNIMGDTPYVRLKVYQGKATQGTIEYELNVG